ncbi:hypothetical protein [Algibacillus agarilyticus]|uniref:hypothetical protein n=1 Tax=Algibacillus agarilyticus TaxID=2234133 RepID=UPI000DD06370|nr:hypothetical protein [Algibacillus agarilyticus]
MQWKPLLFSLAISSSLLGCNNDDNNQSSISYQLVYQQEQQFNNQVERVESFDTAQAFDNAIDQENITTSSSNGTTRIAINSPAYQTPGYTLKIDSMSQTEDTAQISYRLEFADAIPDCQPNSNTDFFTSAFIELSKPDLKIEAELISTQDCNPINVETLSTIFQGQIPTPTNITESTLFTDTAKLNQFLQSHDIELAGFEKQTPPLFIEEHNVGVFTVVTPTLTRSFATISIQSIKQSNLKYIVEYSQSYELLNDSCYTYAKPSQAYAFAIVENIKDLPVEFIELDNPLQNCTESDSALVDLLEPRAVLSTHYSNDKTKSKHNVVYTNLDELEQDMAAALTHTVIVVGSDTTETKQADASPYLQTVDMEQYTYFAIFPGNQPNSVNVGIDKIIELDDKIFVYYYSGRLLDNSPTIGVCQPAISTPFAFYEIPKTNKPIEFIQLAAHCGDKTPS